MTSQPIYAVFEPYKDNNSFIHFILKKVFICLDDAIEYSKINISDIKKKHNINHDSFVQDHNNFILFNTDITVIDNCVVLAFRNHPMFKNEFNFFPYVIEKIPLYLSSNI
jgi:hypothetical protein